MRRDELTDAQWKLIEPLLPKQNRGGRWNDHRTTLDGMLWVLRCGTPWRDMPERYGSWKTVYSRFRRWTDDGTLDKILAKLRARIDRDGLIDWDTWCVDGSNVRASKAAVGAARASKKKAARTRRSRSRTLQRRIWDQAASGLLWERSPHRSDGHSEAGS